jgi:tRNA (mo5U34)-methyltransferase
LRHPLLALERIASVTRELLVLETHVDMLFARRPAIALYPGNELNQDPSNFSGPNPPALIAMLRIVGFKHAEVVWRDSIPRRLGRAARNLLRTGADPWASLQQGRVVVHAWK